MNLNYIFIEPCHPKLLKSQIMSRKAINYITRPPSRNPMIFVDEKLY